jgi:transcriptional regulator with XRE-family HTH domain
MDGKAVTSQLLREARRTKGLSQRSLAQRAGVPQSTIAEIEAGRREPTLTLLSKIIESGGLSVDIQLAPLRRNSGISTARTIAERISGPKHQSLPEPVRQDGALRAVLNLRDALRKASKETFGHLVGSPPSLTGDTRWDAFLAAVVEDEAARKDIPPPRWTNDPQRFQKPFWYLSDNPELHTWEFTTAPGAFVRHGVLAAEDELASV